MNVYKQTYTQEFIDELPIKWDYWANYDLTDVPVKYHPVFTTDWNWGRHSKMDWELRILVNDLFLEYNNYLLTKKSIQVEERPVQGFVKDKEKTY